MTVSILGTEYKVILAKIKEKPKLKNCDGYIDQTIHEIVVGKFKKDNMSVENLKDYANKVMRHEIIHAFLYESGLWDNSAVNIQWARNEEMVDWFAIQAPKILKVFEELKIM